MKPDKQIGRYLRFQGKEYFYDYIGFPDCYEDCCFSNHEYASFCADCRIVDGYAWRPVDEIEIIDELACSRTPEHQIWVMVRNLKNNNWKGPYELIAVKKDKCRRFYVREGYILTGSGLKFEDWMIAGISGWTICRLATVEELENAGVYNQNN